MFERFFGPRAPRKLLRSHNPRASAQRFAFSFDYSCHLHAAFVGDREALDDLTESLECQPRSVLGRLDRALALIMTDSFDDAEARSQAELGNESCPIYERRPSMRSSESAV